MLFEIYVSTIADRNVVRWQCFTKYVTRIIDYSFKILLDFLKVINY